MSLFKDIVKLSAELQENIRYQHKEPTNSKKRSFSKYQGKFDSTKTITDTLLYELKNIDKNKLPVTKKDLIEFLFYHVSNLVALEKKTNCEVFELRNALFNCISTGYVEGLLILLEIGVNPNYIKVNSTCLQNIIEESNPSNILSNKNSSINIIKIVKILLYYGADPWLNWKEPIFQNRKAQHYCAFLFGKIPELHQRISMIPSFDNIVPWTKLKLILVCLYKQDKNCLLSKLPKDIFDVLLSFIGVTEKNRMKLLNVTFQTNMVMNGNTLNMLRLSESHNSNKKIKK